MGKTYITGVGEGVWDEEWIKNAHYVHSFFHVSVISFAADKTAKDHEGNTTDHTAKVSEAISGTHENIYFSNNYFQHSLNICH